MSRWEPEAPERLTRAAFELFAEQGYGATTVPQITARAGLTTRTFFRHFGDKREVLFTRELNFPEVVGELVARAPAGLSPMDLALYGFETISREQFDPWRDQLRARRSIIRSDDGLRERELLKSSKLVDAIRDALQQYGADPADARAAASVGVLMFYAALDDWLDDESVDLVEALRALRERMRRLLSA